MKKEKEGEDGEGERDDPFITTKQLEAFKLIRDSPELLDLQM